MNIHRKINYLMFCIASLIVFVLACGAPPKVIETKTPPPSAQYLIGPEDILKIYVWKQAGKPISDLPKTQKDETKAQKGPDISLKIAEKSRLKNLGNIIEVHR